MNQTLEIVDLENLVNPDECKCESKHHYTPTCSTEVVYWVRGCEYGYKSCGHNVDAPTTGVRPRREHVTCADCLRPAAECWTITPI